STLFTYTTLFRSAANDATIAQRIKARNGMVGNDPANASASPLARATDGMRFNQPTSMSPCEYSVQPPMDKRINQIRLDSASTISALRLPTKVSPSAVKAATPSSNTTEDIKIPESGARNPRRNDAVPRTMTCRQT